MSFAGAQSFWVTGTRVYFQRDPIVLSPGTSPVNQPIIDLGELKNSSPKITTTNVKLFSADGGIAVPIANTIVKREEAYDIVSTNLSMDNLALLFNANPPTVFTQAATPITTSHYCVPGRLLKLHDAAGIPVYGVTSVGSVGSLVAGTDYDFVMPERGFIRFLPGGAFTTAGALSITFTPRAITDPTANRLILPNSQGCVVTGNAFVIWGRCGNQEQTAREIRCTIMSQGGNFVDENYAEVKLTIEMLQDPTSATPAGRLLYWLGGEPPLA